jgi:hypothetical protein
MHTVNSVLAALLLVGVAHAQQSAPAGHYEGVLKAPNREINIGLDIDKHAARGWVGSVDVNIEKGPKGLLLETISVDGDNVSWVLPAFGNAKFTGKYNGEQKTLAGTASTPGGEVPFELKRTGDAKVNLPAPSTPITKDIEGTWEGTLVINDNTLRLSATFSSGEDGKGKGELISIDQGGAKVPVTTITQDGKSFSFEARSVAGAYTGTLNDAKTELSGEWTQGPLKAPLVLKKQQK